jgi:hypothetical protein
MAWSASSFCAGWRGGGRQGGLVAGSGLLSGLFRLLPEVGGGFLAEWYLAAGQRLLCYAQSTWFLATF